MAWSSFHKKLTSSTDAILTKDYPSRVVSCRIKVPMAAQLDAAVVSIAVSHDTPFVVRTWRTTQQEDAVPSRVSLEVICPHWDPQKEVGDNQGCYQTVATDMLLAGVPLDIELDRSTATEDIFVMVPGLSEDVRVTFTAEIKYNDFDDMEKGAVENRIWEELDNYYSIQGTHGFDCDCEDRYGYDSDGEIRHH